MHRLILERNQLNLSISKLAYSLKPKMADLIKRARNIRFVSEDYLYKRHFLKNQAPAIYKKHIETGYASCAFCSNLTRSHCHAHCLKCSKGTYIHCSPLLPGLLHGNDSKASDKSNEIAVPWLFKKTCDNFQRLDFNNYMRNFKVPFSWITVNNYEVFEGIECGYTLNERPCYICATIDYSIYRRCLDSEDYDKNTPCNRISEVIQEAYRA